MTKSLPDKFIFNIFGLYFPRKKGKPPIFALLINIFVLRLIRIYLVDASSKYFTQYVVVFPSIRKKIINLSAYLAFAFTLKESSN